MTIDHPITPPPELVERLRVQAPVIGSRAAREIHLIHASYAAGADQELEAMLAELKALHLPDGYADRLRAARRLNPPSDAEQALELVRDSWLPIYTFTAEETALGMPEPAPEPDPDVPHNRPDTSLRAELLGLIETQRQVILDLAERVDRLEMRADQLTPMERVERRWAQEASGEKLDRLIAEDQAEDVHAPLPATRLHSYNIGPAVDLAALTPDDFVQVEPQFSADGRQPAAVAGEPSDEELREIYEMGHLPTAEELANDDGEDDLGFLCTSAYYRWLEENPAEMSRHEAKCLRAVFNAGARWGSAPPQPQPK